MGTWNFASARQMRVSSAPRSRPGPNGSASTTTRSTSESAPASLALEADGNRIATVKHFRNLVLLGQEARKPIFELLPGDGAMGSHAVAVGDAFNDFMEITQEILRRMGAG